MTNSNESYYVNGIMNDVLQGTVYTALMDARRGEVRGWMRECPDPCWPW